METIGITTTIPCEIPLAAGYRVIDLNNLFISSEAYSDYIDYAERSGFPKSCCAWIKGLYGTCIKNNIKNVLGVHEGDCSNSKALLEVMHSFGIHVEEFSYPGSHAISDVTASINGLMKKFNVSLEAVENVRQKLNNIRRCALEIDELTYKYNKASGFENHLYQVTLSDFDTNPEKCLEMLKAKITEIKKRNPYPQKLRLGYIGVPPMTCDIYDFVQKFNARFVYNEVQREFTFPRFEKAKNIYEQYYDYTYPYDLDFRLHEIKKQIDLRKLDGIIHYTQSFCHRSIEDIVIKKELDIPILTIEGDRLNHLDSRTKLRLEAFLDMLFDFTAHNL